MMDQKFYRYETDCRSNYALDMNGDYVPSLFPPTIELRLIEYNLHKETPKGYWIGYGFARQGWLHSKGRWVSKTAKKRHAYPTKKEALINYIKRTERRVKILKANLRESQNGLSIANELMLELEKP